ncbi:protein Turandot M [Drosophila obscura]|uniref:protein Turandot M n=1 Tax=Drosophila obscura TaxID=7282 RepID=UPI001BB2AEDC|nr:protein Turandot M [Drosophila obscura]
MANAILLVSLMAVLLCLASIGCAQDDSELKSEARRLIDIYNNPEVDTATKFNNLESLAKFYEQHSDYLQLPADQKQRLIEFLEKHKLMKSEEVLVDGVPANGGWLASMQVKGVIQMACDLVGVSFQFNTSAEMGMGCHRGRCAQEVECPRERCETAKLAYID